MAAAVYAIRVLDALAHGRGHRSAVREHDPTHLLGSPAPPPN